MAIETKPNCTIIRGGESHVGKQGVAYVPGISAETAGSRAICLHHFTIPPGARARAHLHQDHETALYILSGSATMYYGEDLSETLIARAGDFLYIPAGVPHLPFNPSESEPCVGILARTDPNEQESVVLRPDLELLVSA